MYIRFTAFWNFSKLQLVSAHLVFTKFLPRWCAPCKVRWALFKSSFPIFRKLCISDFQRFETFWNCCLFCTFGLFAKFLVRWCAPCLLWQTMFRSSFPILRTMYMRFAVLSNLSKLLVCFAHFGFYEISTPVMRTMLTMVNVVQIIISDIAQTVYIKFTMF